MALNKTIVSGLNQVRILFETIISAVPSVCLLLLIEHTQLALFTHKMLETSKAAAAAATPPISTPTPEKKEVSVSLHQVFYYSLELHSNNFICRTFSIEVARSTSLLRPSPLPKMLHRMHLSIPKPLLMTVK